MATLLVNLSRMSLDNCFLNHIPFVNFLLWVISLVVMLEFWVRCGAIADDTIGLARSAIRNSIVA